MTPIRTRPATAGVAAVPPSLFLITSAERRRPWRTDAPHSRRATSIEIDLREASSLDDPEVVVVVDPQD